VIVYELRDSTGDLVAREFSESKITKTRMMLENRGSGPLRLEKLFIQKEDSHCPRVIDPLKKYKLRYGDGGILPKSP
jgi:hypothetical protein